MVLRLKQSDDGHQEEVVFLGRVRFFFLIRKSTSSLNDYNSGNIYSTHVGFHSKSA
jgi:hypothetical protein